MVVDAIVAFPSIGTMSRSDSIINYTSTDAAEYFSTARIHFSQFYRSEQECLKSLITYSPQEVSFLDIGCAAGGLGNAIINEYPSKSISYLGVDINPNTIALGKQNFPFLDLVCSDFIHILNAGISRFTHIISLSCIDWNTSYEESLAAVLRYCHRRKVDFCFSFRSSHKGVNSLSQSYQYVNYHGEPKGEIANYVVLSFDDLTSIIQAFSPSYVYIYASVGSPSPTAVTPYTELTFGCMHIAYGKVPSIPPATSIHGIPVFGVTASIF